MQLRSPNIRPVHLITLCMFLVAFVLLLLYIADLKDTHAPVLRNAKSVEDIDKIQYLMIDDDVSKNDYQSPSIAKDFEELWESCALSQYPNPIETTDASNLILKDISFSEECIAFLDRNIRSNNPFTRYGSASPSHQEFALIQLDNPMTYERIFSDPIGDLARVLDAISRPECLLDDSTVSKWELNPYEYLPNAVQGNDADKIALVVAFSEDKAIAKWQLRTSCHAESFANYAAFYDVCFRESAAEYFLNHQRHYWGHDRESNQINQMWKGYLEQRWVDTKCEEYSSSLELSAEQYPNEYLHLFGIGLNRGTWHFQDDIVSKGSLDRDTIFYTLVSFGAQFGDQAASLVYSANDYWTEQPWRASWEKVKQYSTPSAKRLQEALNLIGAFETTDVNFNLEWLVEHVCTPEKSTINNTKETAGFPSCRTLINQAYTNIGSMSNTKRQTLEKFADVAIKLGVYD